MFTESFITKNNKQRIDNKGKISLLEQGYVNRMNFNKLANKSGSKNNGCFKDFTLTNVRQTAKLIEIKQAIEKLKGFKIEC